MIVCLTGLPVSWVATTAAAETCGGVVDSFNKAVDAGRDAVAEQLVGWIATDAECGRFQIPAQKRLSAFRLDAAQELMARGRPITEYDALLIQSAEPGVLWQAAATLAEVRFGERRFVEAARGFDDAIEIVRNETLTSTKPSPFEVESLVDRSAQARLLAANAAQAQATYVPSARDKRDGMLGGMYAPSVRGIVPHALPLAITFDFDKAQLTGVGADAARDLVRAIQEQQPEKVVIVGHTDVQGGADHNLKLSKDRADAVAAYLHQNGVDVPIETEGVGANQALSVEDSAGLTQDDIYALNRRVEWRRQ